MNPVESSRGQAVQRATQHARSRVLISRRMRKSSFTTHRRSHAVYPPAIGGTFTPSSVSATAMLTTIIMPEAARTTLLLTFGSPSDPCSTIVDFLAMPNLSTCCSLMNMRAHVRLNAQPKSPLVKLFSMGQLYRDAAYKTRILARPLYVPNSC